MMSTPQRMEIDWPFEPGLLTGQVDAKLSKAKIEFLLAFEPNTIKEPTIVALNCVKAHLPSEHGIVAFEIPAEGGGGEVCSPLEVGAFNAPIAVTPEAVEAYRSLEHGIVAFEVSAEGGGGEVHHYRIIRACKLEAASVKIRGAFHMDTVELRYFLKTRSVAIEVLSVD